MNRVIDEQYLINAWASKRPSVLIEDIPMPAYTISSWNSSEYRYALDDFSNIYYIELYRTPGTAIKTRLYYGSFNDLENKEELAQFNFFSAADIEADANGDIWIAYQNRIMQTKGGITDRIDLKKKEIQQGEIPKIMVKSIDFLNNHKMWDFDVEWSLTNHYPIEDEYINDINNPANNRNNPVALTKNTPLKIKVQFQLAGELNNIDLSKEIYIKIDCVDGIEFDPIKTTIDTAINSKIEFTSKTNLPDYVYLYPDNDENKKFELYFKYCFHAEFKKLINNERKEQIIFLLYDKPLYNQTIEFPENFDSDSWTSKPVFPSSSDIKYLLNDKMIELSCKYSQKFNDSHDIINSIFSKFTLDNFIYSFPYHPYECKDFLIEKKGSCGEFSETLKVLIELQGINVFRIAMFAYKNSEEYNFYDYKWIRDIYQTIKIEGVNNSNKTWRFYDHGFIIFEKTAYDPSFTFSLSGLNYSIIPLYENSIMEYLDEAFYVYFKPWWFWIHLDPAKNNQNSFDSAILIEN
ncbi:MAG: hypothetical protein PHV06_06385 [bacterium]|nr:hypothetical protein [bacterium]